MSARQVAMAIFLLMAVLASAWLLLREHERSAPAQFTGPPRSDYQLDTFELASYDDTGKLSFRLHGPRLTHDDARSAFHVDAPKFQFYSRDGVAWNATGKHAQIDTRSKQVSLREDVRVTQASDRVQDQFVLTTQALNADTDNKLLTSDTTVTVQRPGSILRGVGMIAELDSKRFELAAAVRGRFEVIHD